MKKNLLVWLALGLCLLLYSCRSEDDLLNSKDEKYSDKFRVFSAQQEEKINYGNGFKTLLERYDEINKVQHTAKALKSALKNSSKMSEEYVDLNIRSQDVTTKNKEIYTLFPLIRNGQVDGIIIAVLKNNKTQVEYLKMSSEAEHYNEIKQLFRNEYFKNIKKNNPLQRGNGGPCSSEGSPCDTGEVIITVPGGGGGSLPPGGGWVPPGGCSPYEDCLSNPDAGGSGGGGGTPLQTLV
ncbi:MAG: hypothetical protein MUW56_02510 [Chryseobacterium sp.]|uniref:hypothetical protein n=1 Tax=Chryseobacterium sp. TaxID=1871047 RepID=UPI0025BE3E05|nr:hypothetical protein [Chryseobacterium sp.]MCJ7932521.1 hypothetical protein [Chryseobacterium sp.]